jgi:hypothetical protein
MIDTKRREVQSLQGQQLTQERLLAAEEKRLTEEIEKQKLLMIQLQADLARARRLADIAASENTRLTRQVRYVEGNIELMQSQVSRNEAVYEQYVPYREYLNKMLIEGETINFLYGKPTLVVERMRKFEADNLFLITHFQHLESVARHAATAGKGRVDAILAEVDEVLARLDSLAVVPPLDIHVQNAREWDSEYEKLVGLVSQTFRNCLSEDEHLATLSMLERLERTLEGMYRLWDRVAPAFLEYKQGVQDQERRAQQRKQLQEARTREQQRKMQQAFERATKPLKWKFGRPLTKRMLPLVVTNVDNSMEEQAEREQLEEEKLLFRVSEVDEAERVALGILSDD